MPDERATVAELVDQLERVQSDIRRAFDDPDDRAAVHTFDERLGISNRLLALSRALLEMAIMTSKAAQDSLDRSAEGEARAASQNRPLEADPDDVLPHIRR